MRALQRAAGRRALGVSNRLIVWCTGLYPNNFQFLPHYWRDTPYHELRRRIVFDVFAKLPDEVLLKLYPTYRYVDPDPFAGAISLPGNCRVEQFTDFRNLRAAMDVVVVDGPGSTMSWALSAGVPFIFIETRMYSLTEAAREALKRGAFLVDVEDEDWLEQLSELLRMNHRKLLERFAEKRDAREHLSTTYILGPAGDAGGYAADFICRTLSTRHPVESLSSPM